MRVGSADKRLSIRVSAGNLSFVSSRGFREKCKTFAPLQKCKYLVANLILETDHVWFLLAACRQSKAAYAITRLGLHRDGRMPLVMTCVGYMIHAKGSLHAQR